MIHFSTLNSARVYIRKFNLYSCHSLSPPGARLSDRPTIHRGCNTAGCITTDRFSWRRKQESRAKTRTNVALLECNAVQSGICRRFRETSASIYNASTSQRAVNLHSGRLCETRRGSHCTTCYITKWNWKQFQRRTSGTRPLLHARMSLQFISVVTHFLRL
jgi:hypothetical protein